MKAIDLIKYLVVLLDTQSTSFCYYKNPIPGSRQTALIPLQKLEETVGFAVRNDISINFIYGNQKLSTDYQNLIETVKHVKIIPLKLVDQSDDGILVINKDDKNLIPRIEINSHLNLILRLERVDLGELAEIFRLLLGKFRRLNLFLLDIESYTEEDLNEYEKQLKIIETFITGEYKSGRLMEINFISDRMMLNNMNNCDAGITHLTVAPNGKLYLCPGFYYDDPGNSIGELQQGYEIKNSQLLKLSHAPICRNCDAYHCKRCIYLNKKTTFELNTPSHQQCVISHLERNTSMRILEILKPSNENFQSFTSIPEIPYLDTFEIVNEKSKLEMETEERERMVAQLLSKPLEKLSIEELLYQVYRLDKDLLIRLKNINS